MQLSDDHMIISCEHMVVSLIGKTLKLALASHGVVLNVMWERLSFDVNDGD